MVIGELTDVRPEYADKFREFAGMVEESPKQPIGFYGVIFWADQSVDLIKKSDPGFNKFSAAGAFLTIANEEGARAWMKE
jgi:hypothetical protein